MRIAIVNAQFKDDVKMPARNMAEGMEKRGISNYRTAGDTGQPAIQHVMHLDTEARILVIQNVDGSPGATLVPLDSCRYVQIEHMPEEKPQAAKESEPTAPAGTTEGDDVKTSAETPKAKGGK